MKQSKADNFLRRLLTLQTRLGGTIDRGSNNGKKAIKLQKQLDDLRLEIITEQNKEQTI